MSPRWVVTTASPGATAYCYVDEVIGVLADLAPDLREALEQAKKQGLAYVILD